MNSCYQCKKYYLNGSNRERHCTKMKKYNKNKKIKNNCFRKIKEA